MRTPIDWTMRRFLLGAIALVATLGCGKDDQVSRYQVPHEPPKEDVAATLRPTESSAKSTNRSLAAIVPNDGQAWFFKALAPVDQIQGIAGGFDSLLKSVTFTDGKPQWKLPEGWTQSPGNQFRFATLKSGPVEVAVSSLTLPAGGDFQKYLLLNVNRWRGQISLPDIPESQLESVTRKIDLAEGVATIYDSGIGQKNDVSRPEVSRPSENEAQAATGDEGSRVVSANGLTYEVPAGWQTAGRKPMRLATLFYEKDGSRLEITLSRLGANPGSMLANVNRWLGQLDLENIDQALLDEKTQEFVVDGAEGSLFELENPEGNAIYVVVTPRPDSTLFIKMMGPSQLAAEEKATFKRFAESIRFNS